MQQFAIGQRWLSDTESELGLGVLIDVDERAISILFPKSDETRVYARSNAPLSRIVFNVGDMISDQEGLEWQVLSVEDRGGVMKYHAKRTDAQGDEVIKDLNETRLGAHIQLSKPLERMLASQVDYKEWYDLRIQALMMQATMKRSPLRGLLGARVGLIPHQLYIANEVGTRLAPRVLLADEVGLGKTIEAGLIIHQQLKTGRSERVLILVPDSLQYQWMIEMRRRFNLPFSIFDLTRTASIKEHDPELNPFSTEQRIIASIDLMLDHPDLHEQAIEAGFDLLVVDEAHHLIWSEQEGGNDRYDLVEDFANKDKISNLLRFATTHNDSEDQTVSLKDYVERMNDDQKAIYYVTADNYVAAKGSPHLEIFKQKDIEVLLLSDRVDEWLVANFGDHEKFPLKSIAKGDLEDLDSTEDKKKKEKTAKDFEKVISKVQKILENQVKEVKVSSRLSESPSCLIADENEMGSNMERIMKSLGQDVPETKPILEINPKHPLVKKLKTKVDKDLVKVLFDQAVLSEGGQIKEPAEFVKRMNKLMLG